MARDYIKQRKDVQDLTQEVQNLEKLESGILSKLLTTGDAYKEIVDQAKALNQAQSESKQWSEENNKLAENQTKAAQIALSLGKRMGPIGKLKVALKAKELQNTRAQQDFEDDITDSMLEQVTAQQKGINLAGKMNKAVGHADSLMGGVGSTIKDFVMNPLAGIIGILLSFAKTTDNIGNKFGAIGVTEFRSDMVASMQEFRALGLEAEGALTTISTLSTEFGIGFSKAKGMAGAVAELSKSTGMSVESGTKLVGMFTEMGGLSTEGAVQLAKQAESLAVANDVAPGAVLAEVANSTETFAKFAKDGGANILKAAIQARKLGISLDAVAGTAEGLLNFQDSLNAEIEASIMLGRDVNLQKARELSLSGDLEGLGKEILAVVGDETEFNKMNVLQKQALARALNMEVGQLAKIVTKEKEQVTLAGELAKQDVSGILGEEAMSNIAKVLADLQVWGYQLVEELGPQLSDMFDDFVRPFMTMVKKGAEFVMHLQETVGIGNLLKKIFIAIAAKQLLGLGVAIAQAYMMAAAKAPGPAALVAVGLAPLAIAALIASTKGIIGDMVSPADGKTQVSTKEGGLFELSKNDDLLAGPGIAAARTQGSNISTKSLEKTMMENKKEMIALRNDMKSYFGFGGTTAREFGTKVGTIIEDIEG